MNLLPVARCLGNWQHAIAGGPVATQNNIFCSSCGKTQFHVLI